MIHPLMFPAFIPYSTFSQAFWNHIFNWKGEVGSRAPAGAAVSLPQHIDALAQILTFANESCRHNGTEKIETRPEKTHRLKAKNVGSLFFSKP